MIFLFQASFMITIIPIVLLECDLNLDLEAKSEEPHKISKFGFIV